MNIPENKLNKRSQRIHRHVMGNFASCFYIKKRLYIDTLVSLVIIDSDDERRREHDLKMIASNR